MGLAYSIQTPIVLVGTLSGTTRTEVALTTSYQAEGGSAPTKTFEVGGYSKLNLSVQYTMGATETSNSIELKLEESNDRTNWTRLPNESASGGTSTLSAREFVFVGANAATATIGVFIEIAYKYMRVSAKETGVVTNAGSIYIEGLLSGK